MVTGALLLSAVVEEGYVWSQWILGKAFSLASRVLSELIIKLNVRLQSFTTC